MPAIDLLPRQYDAIKTKRKYLEEEARIEIRRKMDDLNNEFEALVFRAVKQEGAKISEVCRAIGVSNRTKIYEILEHFETSNGPLRKASLAPEYDQYFSWTEFGDVHVVYPQFRDEKIFMDYEPSVDIDAFVRKVGSQWEVVDFDVNSDYDLEGRAGKILLWEDFDPAQTHLNYGFTQMLNDWSGK